jgi:hypothetical protein
VEVVQAGRGRGVRTFRRCDIGMRDVAEVFSEALLSVEQPHLMDGDTA